MISADNRDSFGCGVRRLMMFPSLGAGAMTAVHDPCGAVERASALVRLFCSPEDFGVLRGVGANEVPEPARSLLDHRSHMTVAMERFHRGDVRLRVVAVVDGDRDAGCDAGRGEHARPYLSGDNVIHDLRPRSRPQETPRGSWVDSRRIQRRSTLSTGCYAREILLETQAGKTVQFGIVRIHMDHLDPSTASTIREARRPLGRILIDAGLLREVERVGLLEILPGRHLERLFGLTPAAIRQLQPRSSGPVYGRVADIRIDGRPAIELLEIVAPECLPGSTASGARA